MTEKVTKRVRLDFKGAKGTIKENMKIAAGEILVEEILRSLDKSSSPVEDGKFKKLKKNNQASKLFDKGDLWPSIDFEPYRDGVEVGVFDEAQTGKAKGHNTGFKGHPTIPEGKYTREFIPKKTQEFREKIKKKVNRKLSDILKEEAAIDKEASKL